MDRCFNYSQQLILNTLCYIAVVFIAIASGGEHYDIPIKTTTISDVKLTINRKFELNIGLSTQFNPDCFNVTYPQLIVNNQYPAPALHLAKNDVVQVTVKTTLTGTTINPQVFISMVFDNLVLPFLMVLPLLLN